MKKTTLLALAVLVAAGAVSAEIYKWIDSEGQVHYGEHPPADTHQEKMEITPGPSEKEIQRAKERSTQLIQEHERARKEQLLQERKDRERPQKVLGTVAIEFLPQSVAVMPEPPIELTLRLKPVGGGASITHRISDPSPAWVFKGKGKIGGSHQNFALTLRPGRYRITGLIAQSMSLSGKPIALPSRLPEPTFTVPVGNCVYVGRIVLAFMRLPGGSFEQSQASVKLLADKLKLTRTRFLYLTKGSLIPLTTHVERPSNNGHTHDGKILSQARQERCLIKPAAQ